MKKILLLSLLALFLFVAWLLPQSDGYYPRSARRILSAAPLIGRVFEETITPEMVRAVYGTRPIKILLVPGHDNEYSGAVWNGLREADVNLQLANALQRFLTTDQNFSTQITRNENTGNYNQELSNYFVTNREEIKSFRQRLRQTFVGLIQSGAVEEKIIVSHNFAKEEVAQRLYGINKWANEQGIDLAIHIHFNDYAGRSMSQAGRHNGLAIYIPERQYPNARFSAEIGQSIFSQLNKILPTSSLPGESTGLIEDQELIALGSYASRDGGAVLIEYSYIYEPQVANVGVRSAWLTETAWQTYLGIKNYFEPATTLPPSQILQQPVSGPLHFGQRGNKQVLALQRALQLDCSYPPAGRELGVCPINGNFGPCVQSAVTTFQTKYALIDVPGQVGEQTLAELNRRYGH